MTAHARNLELKVRCPPAALDAIHARLVSLACGPIERLHQVDTYLRVDRGRLKLREIRSVNDPSRIERAELIAYQRPADAGSRWSAYRVVPVAPHLAPDLLAGLLMTHDQAARVDKVRQVGIIGHTRVHLDRVDGLGAFVELETVIAAQTDAQASAEHRQVIDALGLAAWPAIAGSYGDLVGATG